MSAHSAKQIRRRAKGRPDDAGPCLEWEAALNEWAELKGIPKRPLGMKPKKTSK